MSSSMFHSWKKKQPKPRELSFTLQKSHTYVANALRRLMLSELYSAGIPDHYHNAGTGVHMIKNTGRLHNEFIAHRVSMLHLALSPEQMQLHSFVLCLRCECPATAKDPINVTSNDIRLFKIHDGKRKEQEEQEEREVREVREEREEVKDVRPYLVQGATQLIPTDPVVDALNVGGASLQSGVLLTRLYPDEVLEIDMYPMVGRVCDYAGFSPLHTCTYEQTNHADNKTKDFHFTVNSLGSYDCQTLVAKGLRGLCEKVELTKHLLGPRTVELVVGSNTPALQTLVSTKTKTCWVRWSNVDVLTSLGAPKSFYQKHCQEVIASSAPTDVPLKTKPYAKDKPVPGVDGEDVHTSNEKTKLVLAMHQPTFATNGIYEYNSTKRQYKLVNEPRATYTIMKEGCTQRALVYTKVSILQVHDDRCVLQFGEEVGSEVFEHLVGHIDGLVCAGSGVGEPPVHLAKPNIARDSVHVIQETDKALRVLVDEEDHTLGNLVQGYIYDTFLRTDKKMPKTTLLAIAYNKPLPSEKRIQFRFEFSKPTSEDECRRFFTTQLDAIHKELLNMEKQW